MGKCFKVLITGMDGFTGRYLHTNFVTNGFECFSLGCDLLDMEAVLNRVISVAPDYVVHLAGLSFAAEKNIAALYNINVSGTLNLLNALRQLPSPPKKVILASSANVYGATGKTKLDERLHPKPLNHYGCSKMSMEHMAQNYFEFLPIIITRPFNYTGVSHDIRFLIPKIVDAYRRNIPLIELGNIEVSREFNDIRDVANVYRLLLRSSLQSDVVNICSGESTSLLSVFELMDEMTHRKMKIITSKEFSRDHEIKELSGDTKKLNSVIEYSFEYKIKDTLTWMFESS